MMFAYFEKKKSNVCITMLQNITKFALAKLKYRDVAQLAARVVRDDEVAGSNPVIPTWRKRIKR